MHQSTRKPSKASSSGQVRIIGGSKKGHKLRFNSVAGLRPTLDRVRETLFNWLMYDISGAVCLDLFAGSGALGFEALSRGADSVTFVEKHRKVAAQLQQNYQKLGFKNARISNIAAETAIKKSQQVFDIVFIDPPFYQDYVEGILTLLHQSSCLKPESKIYVECEKQTQTLKLPEGWSILKHSEVGQSLFYLLSCHDEQ